MKRSEQEIIANVAANEFKLNQVRTALKNNPEDKGAIAEIDSLVMRQDELRKEMKERGINVDAGNISSDIQDLAATGPDMNWVNEQLEGLKNAPRFQNKPKPSALQSFVSKLKDFFVGIYNRIIDAISNASNKKSDRSNETVRPGDLEVGVPGEASAGKGAGPEPYHQFQQEKGIKERRVDHFNKTLKTYQKNNSLSTKEKSALKKYAKRGCTNPPAVSSDAMGACIKLIYNRFAAQNLLADEATMGAQTGGGKIGETVQRAGNFAGKAKKLAEQEKQKAAGGFLGRLSGRK